MNDLKEEFKKAANVKKLNDFDVIRLLKESRNWNRDLKDVNERVLELKELVVVYPLPVAKADELDKLHESIVATFKKTVKELETEDRDRMLYTLTKSNSKDSIPYPIFRSRPYEDVHKFIREFKEVLVRNQIPKKDQVKILLVYLEEFALEMIHEDLGDINEAYKILESQFGSSDLVFSAKFQIFLNECENDWPAVEKQP